MAKPNWVTVYRRDNLKIKVRDEPDLPFRVAIFDRGGRGQAKLATVTLYDGAVTIGPVKLTLRPKPFQHPSDWKLEAVPVKYENDPQGSTTVQPGKLVHTFCAASYHQLTLLHNPKYTASAAFPFGVFIQRQKKWTFSQSTVQYKANI